jgi:Spy/CpxP family protein refolding chaperone
LLNQKNSTGASERERSLIDRSSGKRQQQQKIDFTQWRYQMKRVITWILMVTVLAIFGSAPLAFARHGSGHHGAMETGSGSWGWDTHWGQICGYGPGYGYSGNLTQRQVHQLERMRAGFLQETKAFRQQLCANTLTLRNELARGKPDSARISSLKSEISRLQAELDRRSADFGAAMHRAVPGFNCIYRPFCPRINAGP